MRLCKDMLNTLGIETAIVSTKQGDAPCAITDAMGNVWVCFMTIPPENANVVLRVKTTEGFLRFKGEIVTPLSSNKPGLYAFVIRVFSDFPTSNELLRKLCDIENRKEEWNKRIEERWIIGNEHRHIQDFGLTSASQSVYVDKHPYQCCIHDVSFHGLGLVVFDASIKGRDSLYVKLSFVNPIECLHIDGKIVSLHERQQHNVLVSKVGLSIPSSSMAYMGRVALYAAKKERRA